MKRYPWILLFCLCLVPQGMATEPDSKAADKAARKSSLSSDLELFVRGAIDEGFLTPVDPGHSGRDGQVEAEDHFAEGPGSQTPTRSIPDAIGFSPCNGAEAIDFSELKGVTRYQDLYVVRASAESESGELTLPDASPDLAKAYIALGLYPEALMTLKQAPSREVASYQKLAMLMDNRHKPDISFFREMAGCQEGTEHWLAVAQLVAGEGGGAQHLQDSLTGFRSLPLQLRIDVASLSIPALERTGEKALARKLIADFTAEEIQNSPQLQFTDALVKLDSGDTGAEKIVVSFLDDPQFQEQALEAVMRQRKSMDPAYEEVLLNDLLQKFGQENGDRHLASSLQFALQELSARSSYEPIIKLAAMPAFQNAAAQSEVKRQLVLGLERDLGSDDPLRNLAAISALAGESTLLDGDPARDRLFKTSTQRAIHFGFMSLAARLASKSTIDEAVVVQVAALAYQRNDYSAVYALANAHPNNAAINVLAAKSAIKDEDRPLLEQFESRATLDPASILALIEQDAVTGHWLVSDQVYDAALQLTGTDHKQRVARVTNLRLAARNLTQPAEPMTMMRASALLKSKKSSEGTN